MKRIVSLLSLFLVCIITASPVATAAPARTVAPSVWFFGDSISTGQGLTSPSTESWVAQLSKRATITPVNWAKPGYAFDGYLGMISDELNTAYASGKPIPHTAIIDAGSNDLVIHDTNTIQSSKNAALVVKNSLLAHGVQRVIFTGLIPRGDGYEPVRQNFNMWLALSFGSDYQAVEYFFNPVTPFPAQYYQPDLLHPNAYGAQVMANSFDIARIIK
jgi:lysophospholipase L1-like esterase